MLGLAGYIECTVSFQLQLPFTIDTGLLFASCSVGERIDCTLLGGELDTFGVGDIDCSAVGVGQCQTR